MMTEKQFLDLCSACKSILQHPTSTLARIAIPWMHPIREHPIALARYMEIFYPDGWLANTKKIVKRFFFQRAIWLRQLYRAISRGNCYWHSIDKLGENIDCLFVSHVVNPSYLKKTDDFYFATIPGELAELNYKVLVGYMNNLGSFEKKYKNQVAKSLYSKIYFTDTLTLAKEWEIRKKIRLESESLKKNAAITNDLLLKKIYKKASVEILGGEAQASLRVFEQVKKLVQSVNPKSIIIPYEGHAYERICFAAARSVNPRIICMSYQHTGIFRLSNAIRQTLAQEYNPDIILAPGNETKKELEKIPAFKSIRIEVLGSIRGSSNIEKRSTSFKKKDHACLVMPEGIISECIQLFSFSLQCALLRPDIKFIWRLHPSITFKEIMLNNKSFAQLPNNIILSSNTLESDIEICNWVLYRGTTAIFKAISEGLRPFYLECPDELTIDPLYKLSTWRIRLNKSQEMINCMLHDINTDFVDFEKSLPIALDVCNERFANLNIDVLDNILKENIS